MAETGQREPIRGNIDVIITLSSAGQCRLHCHAVSTIINKLARLSVS